MRQGFGVWQPAARAHVPDHSRDGMQASRHRVPFSPPAGVMREDTVESETHPGTYYHLRLRGDGTWSCDCPGYTYRAECKHSRRKQEERPW